MKYAERISTKETNGIINVSINISDWSLRLGSNGQFESMGFDIPKNKFKYNEKKCCFNIGTFNEGFIEIKEGYFPIQKIGPISPSNIDELFKMMLTKKYYSTVWIKYKNIFGDEIFSSLDFEHFKFFHKIFTNSHLANKAFMGMVETVFSKKFDTTTSWNEKYSRAISKIRVDKPKMVGFNKIRQSFISEISKNLELLISKNALELEFQNEFYRTIQIIWPNYVGVIRNKHLKGFSNEVYLDNEIDYICLDINGNIDVIEIKDSSNTIFLDGKYRNGVYPLSKSITAPMAQLNHAIHKITKINKAKKQEMAKLFDVELEFINFETPKGILVMGKTQKMGDMESNSFTNQMSQYKNLANFYTYDDILMILKNIGKVSGNNT